MGVLELIKIGRIFITTIKVYEDVVEYEEKGLDMMFKLNPDYIPPDDATSEFDNHNTDTEEKTDE